MSKSNSTQITCPKCRVVQTISIWESVTASHDLERKKMVVAGTIFDQTCRNCKSRMQVTHPILYHDPNIKLAIWLCDGGITPTLEDAMDSFGMMVPKDYRLRIVYNLSELVEKIRIFESGFNDFFIQMLKLSAAESAKTSVDVLHLIGIEMIRSAESFRFKIGEKDQSVSISGVDNPRRISKKWDLLESEFDWLYVNMSNFYSVFTKFQNRLA